MQTLHKWALTLMGICSHRCLHNTLLPPFLLPHFLLPVQWHASCVQPCTHTHTHTHTHTLTHLSDIAASLLVNKLWHARH